MWNRDGIAGRLFNSRPTELGMNCDAIFHQKSF